MFKILIVSIFVLCSSLISAGVIFDQRELNLNDKTLIVARGKTVFLGMYKHGKLFET